MVKHEILFELHDQITQEPIRIKGHSDWLIIKDGTIGR